MNFALRASVGIRGGRWNSRIEYAAENVIPCDYLAAFQQRQVRPSHIKRAGGTDTPMVLLPISFAFCSLRGILTEIAVMTGTYDPPARGCTLRGSS